MPRHHLHGRLERAQDDLLTAIVKGPDALIAFQNQWSKLVADFDEEAHQLDDDVLEMANSTASIVSTLTGSFLALETKATDLYSKLSKGLEDALDNDEPLVASSSHSLSPVLSHSYRDLYAWLQQNLHNPYPSATVKANLVASSGLSSEYVTAWFHNAREQIGWTTLARHRFKGSRSAIVDAARCAFLQSDDNRSLPSTLRHAFSVIKQNLDNLRPDTDKCVIARELESEDILTVTIESDMHTPQRPLAPDSPRLLQLPTGDDNKEDEEDMAPPPPIAGCKRRADTELRTDQTSRTFLGDHVRPLKRHRSDSLLPCGNPYPSQSASVAGTASHDDQTTFPSVNSAEAMLSVPSTNTSISTSASPLPPFTTPLTSQSSTNPPNNRKRRLSDANCDVITKRPRSLRSGPRMQTISDPFPRATEKSTSDPILFESWYKAFTNQPSEPFISDLSDDSSNSPSPATTALNTPLVSASCNELSTSPTNCIIPSQQVELSDEAFQAMLVYGYDMSSNLMPFEQDVPETMFSLDDLFPSSVPGLAGLSPTEQPGQCFADMGVRVDGTSQLHNGDGQSLFSSPFLLETPPHHGLLHTAPASSLNDFCQDDLCFWQLAAPLL
uniref:B1 homeodomain mating type protein n=1 Tax=Heterobasidion occidentale TaxID=942053 RepID=S5RA31_9AGAM|nr:b1 homeodomain mating type protein [Heterobasidion occidentale]